MLFAQKQSLANNRDGYLGSGLRYLSLFWWRRCLFTSGYKILKYCFANFCNALRELTDNYDLSHSAKASCLVFVISGFHSQLKTQNSVCSARFQYLTSEFIEAPFISTSDRYLEQIQVSFDY